MIFDYNFTRQLGFDPDKARERAHARIDDPSFDPSRWMLTFRPKRTDRLDVVVRAVKSRANLTMFAQHNALDETEGRMRKALELATARLMLSANEDLWQQGIVHAPHWQTHGCCGVQLRVLLTSSAHPALSQAAEKFYDDMASAVRIISRDNEVFDTALYDKRVKDFMSGTRNFARFRKIFSEVPEYVYFDAFRENI